MSMPVSTVLKSMTSVAVTTACLLLASYPDTAAARGGLGGSGLSRSSPASGGNFSSRPVQQPTVGAPDRSYHSQGGVQSVSGARQVGGAHSTGGAGSAGGARATGGAGSVGGVGQPGGIRPAGSLNSPVSDRLGQPGQVQPLDASGRPRAEARQAAPVSAAEMESYRQQFLEQNRKDSAWDAPHVEQPIYDPNLDEKRRAVVVGTAAGVAVARERNAVGYVVDDDVVYTVDDLEEHSEVPCSIEGMMAGDDGVTYYRCENAWYRRGVQGGNVVYIKTDPPPGQ